jgi:quinolinate synthase
MATTGSADTEAAAAVSSSYFTIRASNASPLADVYRHPKCTSPVQLLASAHAQTSKLHEYPTNHESAAATAGTGTSLIPAPRTAVTRTILKGSCSCDRRCGWRKWYLRASA